MCSGTASAADSHINPTDIQLTSVSLNGDYDGFSKSGSSVIIETPGTYRVDASFTKSGNRAEFSGASVVVGDVKKSASMTSSELFELSKTFAVADGNTAVKFYVNGYGGTTTGSFYADFTITKV